MRTITAAVIALTLLVSAGCSDDGDEADPDPSTTVVAPTARFTADGVTFPYPSDLVDRVTAEERAGGASFVRVRFEGEALAEPGELVVTPVRDAAGELLASVPEPAVTALGELDRMLDEAEADADADADAEEGPAPLDFVNGTGVRTATPDGATTRYTFLGRTDDGRLLIDLALSVGPGTPAERFDELVGGLFADPDAAALAPEACDDGLEILARESTADDGPVAPGATVEVTWRVRNTGACTWTDRWSWVFGGGAPVTLVSVDPVPTTAPGEEAALGVTIVAPDEPGVHAAQWQMVGTDGRTPVGPPADVTVQVG